MLGSFCLFFDIDPAGTMKVIHIYKFYRYDVIFYKNLVVFLYKKWFNQYTFKSENYKKGGVYTIYERMLKEYERIGIRIAELKKQLRQFPEGKLICARNGSYYKWYESNLHTKNYIPKSRRKHAEKLAAKKYLSLQLEELENEKKAIQFYLRHHNNENKAERLLTQSSEYRELLSSNFIPVSKQLSEWISAPFIKNSSHPEQLIFKGCSGNILRSKSEVLIDMFLYTNRIPFRYECELQLEDGVVYPDFTIRHPVTGEIYYWEHFGMMDNPVYSQNAYSKLQRYNASGIIPSIQLITTYETKEYPLRPEVIESIVREYFLNDVLSVGSM